MSTIVSTHPQQARMPSAAGRLGRAVAALLVFLFALAATGATYQAIAEASDRRAFLAPGRLVGVGGHRLHIHCVGEGSPTVVLDHMGGANSAQWALVQPQLAAETRVCTYDRAGFGWSDPAPSALRDAQGSAEELHALLTNAGEPGPFLLVGHSYGARVAKLFAASYPNEVAGLVLVDPGYLFGHPAVAPEIDSQWRAADQFFIRNGPALARLGVFRLLYSFTDASDTGDLSAAERAAFLARATAAQQWDAIRAEGAGMDQSSVQELAVASLGDLPLLVLSAGQPASAGRTAWTNLNAEAAALSSRGEHRVIVGAGHTSFAWEQRYADVVTSAVRELLANGTRA